MAVVKQPFFVVGSGRTGSTFLYHMLADHPRIALTNEGRIADFLFFCSQFASVPQKHPHDFALHEEFTLHGVIRESCIDCFSPIFLRHATQMLEEFYEERFSDKDFTHWGDKLPWPATALALQDPYPNARYIVLIRDPRAISASLLTYRERDLPAGPLLQKQSPVKWSTYWNNSYRGLLEYLNSHIVVRYEDLVADPLREMTRILDYLGLDGAERLVELASRRDTFAGHATSDNPEASIDRWKTALSREDIEAIEQICGELMKAHGYELATG